MMPRPPTGPVAIEKPRLLIGEGEDEVNFFKALLKHLEIDSIQVEQFGGKNQLRVYLMELRRRSGHDILTSVGVTRDADNACTSAFASVSDALKEAQFPVPPGPGQVTRIQGVNAGVFIMPDNVKPGMLEDLCLRSVETIDKSFHCIEQFFDCVKTAANRQPPNMAKARTHAWLATQNEPDRSLGLGAAKGYWPFQETAFQPLIEFIRAL
jgi:hypothetical protein